MLKGFSRRFEETWCLHLQVYRTWFKCTVKFTPEQATEAHRCNTGVAVLFLETWRWMRLGGHRHAPAALPLVKTQYPLCRWLGGSQGRSGPVRNISPPPPPRFDRRSVKPVASRYTDWAASVCWSNWRKENIGYLWRLEGSLLNQREMQIRPVHGWC